MAKKKQPIDPADESLVALSREWAKSHRDPQIKAALADYVRLADEVAAWHAAPRKSAIEFLLPKVRRSGH